VLDTQQDYHRFLDAVLGYEQALVIVGCYDIARNLGAGERWRKCRAKANRPVTRLQPRRFPSLDELLAWLGREGIWISEGPVMMGHGRRKVCFIRDPDLSVLELNEILP
jgi:hypothetical protein